MKALIAMVMEGLKTDVSGHCSGRHVIKGSGTALAEQCLGLTFNPSLTEPGGPTTNMLKIVSMALTVDADQLAPDLQGPIRPGELKIMGDDSPEEVADRLNTRSEERMRSIENSLVRDLVACLKEKFPGKGPVEISDIVLNVDRDAFILTLWTSILMK